MTDVAKQVESIWQKLGGTKFLGFVIIISATVLLGWLQMLNPNSVTILLGAYAFYCGANVANTRKAINATQREAEAKIIAFMKEYKPGTPDE